MNSSITSVELREKSLQAALAAIEIYNKPNFGYREETFAILMCNAWELLLKAKSLVDNKEDFNSIVGMRRVKDETTGVDRDVPKTNRSGNTLTVGLIYLASRMLEQQIKGISPPWLKNIELLAEVRDNAVHLASDDLALSKTILEIGTAALKNYMTISTDWFGTDFVRYNFYLMPISFFHGFEVARALSTHAASNESKKFLDYVNQLDLDEDSGSPHHVILTIETKVVKGKGSDGLAVRWTNDPSAPAMRIREEDLLERYPYDSGDLAAKLRDRYNNFKQDAHFYKLKRPMDSDAKYCRVRYLDPKNPRSGSKKFYSTEVFKIFDLHYRKKD